MADALMALAKLEWVKTRTCQCKPYRRYTCPNCEKITLRDDELDDSIDDIFDDN